VLALLYRGMPGTAWARCGRGPSSNTFSWPAARLHTWPQPLVRELGYDPPGDVRFVPATLTTSGSDLVACRVVWAEVQCPAKPDRNGGWHVVDTEPLDRALDLLPPSLVMFQGFGQYLVAWALDRAVIDLAALCTVQAALAERVGTVGTDDEANPRSGPGPAIVPALPLHHPLRPVLRCPGSRNCTRGDGALVYAEYMAPVVYTLAKINAALAVARKKEK